MRYGGVISADRACQGRLVRRVHDLDALSRLDAQGRTFVEAYI